jgi:hypothetical protein
MNDDKVKLIETYQQDLLLLLSELQNCTSRYRKPRIEAQINRTISEISGILHYEGIATSRSMNDYAANSEIAANEAIGIIENVLINSRSRLPVIFISHCRKDMKYGDALLKYISGLGVPDKQIIYTSHPLHKVPFDASIYSYLREFINSGRIYMVYLWSGNYLSSVPCLCEMGAAWIVGCDYSNFFVPGFDFSDSRYIACPVDKLKMGNKLVNDLHCRQGMREFKDKVSSIFKLAIGEAHHMNILEVFMHEIEEAAKP